MPRIDPQQLLNCLQVLLSPTGGILSKNEVQRLANLMTKFSKKLVSKCIYVLILKNTERQLLGQFMSEGGWNLIHLWLQDAHINKNWALVAEVLELLLITPVDVERLKMNNLPKLVKSLTKRDDLPGIQQLSTSLVELWLTIVKDVTKQEQMINQQQVIAAIEREPTSVSVMETVDQGNDPEPMEIDETINREPNIIVNENGVDASSRMKKVLSRAIGEIADDTLMEEATGQSADASDSAATDASNGNKNEDSEGTDKENSDKNKKQKAVPKKSSSSCSSSNSSKTSSSRDKERDKSRDRSKSGSRSSSSKSSSSRDKDRRDRDKDRHRHNGSSSSSSSSKHRSNSSSKSSSSSKETSKDAKEKQAERDKDTLSKIQPQVLQKLGRIPKKTEDSKSSEKKDSKSEDKKDLKKPSFSVEVRKGTEEKPKTVKVYNSKMRSTGLLEEAKPPLPRSATKKTAPPPVIPANIPTKRSSPIRDTIPPPEKKSRLLDPEKGIKLIPPKPKPVLQESDIFMDALAASATAKKEPKKRKRRTSVSKDASPPTSPSAATKPPTSPPVVKSITPANFYQDTLVTAENEDHKESENMESMDDTLEENLDDKEREKSPETPTESDQNSAPVETTKTDANGLKGVLSYAKRKGPKRSLRWRPDTDLVEVQYFELDETERVNVMKPFMDMQRMEMSSEREAMRQRKLPNEDTMESQMPWRILIEIETPTPPAEFGAKSLERNIQFAREKRVLQAIYFNNRIPDAPDEPDVEINPTSISVIIIPLTDPDQPEQEALIQPWPEAKGSPPHITNTPPSLFNTVIPPQFIQVPPNFTPNGLPQFAPSFVPPGMLTRPPGDWNILPNGLPPNIPPPELMQQAPPLFDNFGGPQGPPDGPFPPPFGNAPNPMPQMFPPNQFNNNMRGRGGFRRGGPNSGPWMRMGAPNQSGWNNNQNRGRGFCNSFKQKGFCRNRDNCPYIH